MTRRAVRSRVFRHPAGYTNGNTVDRQGRLVTCEHGNRRVTRTEYDGSITVIADRFEGKRLNSPNDVVVKSDGSIWFTDPPYGIDTDYEGHTSEREVGGCHVYRVDGASGVDHQRRRRFRLPERHRILAATRSCSTSSIPAPPMSPTGRAISRKFAVSEDGKLSGGEVFATCPDGLFDGFRLDTEGRIWTSAGGGVLCYDPDGTLIGKIKVPEVVANVCFGGIKRNRLFICGTTSLYAVWVMGNGHKTF